MKTMRMSGMPVRLDHLENWKKDWIAGFDEAKAVHGQDMIAMQATLEELQKSLEAKYPLTENWPVLSTLKQIRKKMDEYMCPIMIAQSSENPKELVYVLMDQNI